MGSPCWLQWALTTGQHYDATGHSVHPRMWTNRLQVSYQEPCQTKCNNKLTKQNCHKEFKSINRCQQQKWLSWEILAEMDWIIYGQAKVGFTLHNIDIVNIQWIIMHQIGHFTIMKKKILTSICQNCTLTRFLNHRSCLRGLNYCTTMIPYSFFFTLFVVEKISNWSLQPSW